MKHPTATEWMDFLYGDLAPDAHRELAQHLADCAECHRQMAAWQATQQRLSSWTLPPSRSRRQVFAPLFKWAIAAIFVIGIGILVARLTAPTLNSAALQAAIEPNLRKQLVPEMQAAVAAARAQDARFLNEFAQRIEALRTEDRATVMALFNDLEAQQQTDYAAIRKDLETVAVLTENQFVSTRQQLGWLAASMPSTTVPQTTVKGTQNQ